MNHAETRMSCGRAALEHARGRLPASQPFTIESTLGTTFTVTVVGETDFAGYRAVIPEVSGRAWITGGTSLCARRMTRWARGSR